MKKQITFVLACTLSIATLKAQQSPYLQKSFPRGSISQVMAQTSGGNISVTGESSGEARVEVYINSGGGRDALSKEEIKQRVDEQYDLTVALEGGVLKAIAKTKKPNLNWRKSLSISFRIYAPKTVGTSLKTSGGNIDLKGVSGTSDFRTSGGNLELADLSGKITGKTSGGNVSITHSKDNIDLQTSGGNMDAKECEGTIRLATSGGNVHLQTIKGTIHATTSGGQIEGGEITGELQTRTSGGNIDLTNVTGSLAASTSGGNIHVNVMEPKYVDLSNSGGDITLELPQGKGMDLNISGDQVHSSSMNNFKGDVSKHRINGTLNGGGIPVKVDGNSGSVHLSFK
jgi:DUF4097 and DUF4098 domain-containing protein YvlB